MNAAGEGVRLCVLRSVRVGESSVIHFPTNTFYRRIYNDTDTNLATNDSQTDSKEAPPTFFCHFTS